MLPTVDALLVMSKSGRPYHNQGQSGMEDNAGDVQPDRRATMPQPGRTQRTPNNTPDADSSGLIPYLLRLILGQRGGDAVLQGMVRRLRQKNGGEWGEWNI
jgi:hypothetical protein